MNALNAVIFSSFLCLVSSIFSQENSDGFTQLAGNKGGKLEFKRVFKQEVVYPEKSLREKTKGIVTFKFIVMKDGSIKEINKTDSVNSEIDKEAFRIFKMLEWQPSIYRGDTVNSFIDVKFHFKPAQYRRIVKSRGYEKINYPEAYKYDTTMKVYEKVDEPAVYISGTYALIEFISKNVEYPKQAQMNRIRGTVGVSFVIEPSGYATNFHVVKSLGFGCDEEAIRVLSLAKWQPAKVNGVYVRYRMNFPFIFELSEEFKDNSHGEQK